MTEQSYAIGRFSLLPNRQLVDGAVLVDIGGKALDILTALAQASGNLVTKDELLAAVWPNTFVEENAIQVHVSAARRALGDEAGRLATVWGRGYTLDTRPRTPPPMNDQVTAEYRSFDVEAKRLVRQAQALAGRATPEALLRAIDLHERAIARAPGFPAAWTGLAGTLMVAAVTNTLPPERCASARAMAEQAIRIDVHSGAPHAIRAVLAAAECQWLEAQAGFEAAVDRSPQDAWILESAALSLWASIGHTTRAAELIFRAERLAPGSANIALSSAYMATLSDNLSVAATLLETAVLLGASEDRAMARVMRIELALADGDTAKAEADIGALMSGSPSLRRRASETASMMCGGLTGRYDSTEVSAFVLELVAAAACDDGLKRSQVQVAQLARWLVAVGALDSAFAMFEHILDDRNRSGFLPALTLHGLWHCDMISFRADPRFGTLTRRLGLAHIWQQFGPPDGWP